LRIRVRENDKVTGFVGEMRGERVHVVNLWRVGLRVPAAL
jgi:hypothetical protein